MSGAQPTAWSSVKDSELRGIRGVCLDIDDTLSSHGKLTAEAYAALWKLKERGFYVVPITGRPAGWCDHFSRFWPVDAVVGENGAFTFYMQKNVRRRLDTPGWESDGREKLTQLGKEVCRRFPGTKWASDQPYREYDLAIDICEDVPRWKEADVEELLQMCQSAGAHAKLSSIHVNTWFGSYDKCSGMRHWLESGAPGLELSAGVAPPKWDEWIFIGDSPNDEPMFKNFHLSVGVANIKTYLDRLQNPPRWVTASESGGGFTEFANRLIQVGPSA